MTSGKPQPYSQGSPDTGGLPVKSSNGHQSVYDLIHSPTPGSMTLEFVSPTHRNIRLIPNSNPGLQGAFSWDLWRGLQQVIKSAAPRKGHQMVSCQLPPDTVTGAPGLSACCLPSPGHFAS